MTDPSALLSAGLDHHRAGRLDEAGDLYRQVLGRQPDQPDAAHLLGLIALQRGRAPEAEALIARAASAAPAAAVIHNSHAEALLALDRADDAAAAARRALALQPAFIEAMYNLGRALQLAPQAEAARAVYARLLQLAPYHRAACNNAGVILLGKGAVDDAVRAFHRALRIAPGDPEALTNLGAALARLGAFTRARQVLARAVRADPRATAARGSLANATWITGDLESAASCYRTALVLDPAHPVGLGGLGGIMLLLGQHRAALAMIARAAQILPESAEIARNLLMAQTYVDPRVPPRPWPAAAPRRFANDPDPERRLRIGVLSSDLRNHVVGRAYLPLFQARNRAAIELFCYQPAGWEDEITAVFRADADAWRDLRGLDDAAAASLMRQDAIDLLLVFCGRVDENRPGIAAQRAAPVQLSIGDLGTSGIAEMDYILADPVQIPRRGAERFSERPVRLPGLYYRSPPLDAPEPGLPPLLSGAAPRFGSFNNPAKLTDEVLDLWGRVLAALPGSTLLLKYKNWFAAPSLQSRVQARLAAQGADAGQARFATAPEDYRTHLGGYRAIDIALDPFPFSGSNTTLEALWMGVPVVTLAGDAMVGRTSASLLTTLGMRDLIAGDAAAYLAICRRLAADAQDLARRRTALRPRLAASPILDVRLRARQHERLFRALWRRWCRDQA